MGGAFSVSPEDASINVSPTVSDGRISQSPRADDASLSFGHYFCPTVHRVPLIVQELCESRGGRPGLSVLTSLLVSVDVKIY